MKDILKKRKQNIKITIVSLDFLENTHFFHSQLLVPQLNSALTDCVIVLELSQHWIAPQINSFF